MSECTENKQNNFLETTLTSNLALFLQGTIVWPQKHNLDRWLYLTLAVYDLLTGKVVKNLDGGHRTCVRDVDWHPYQHTLITSSVSVCAHTCLCVCAWEFVCECVCVCACVRVCVCTACACVCACLRYVCFTLCSESRDSSVLEWQTRHQKVLGLSPGGSSRRLFFSRVNFLCWLLFWYLFYLHVTTVIHLWFYCGQLDRTFLCAVGLDSRLVIYTCDFAVCGGTGQQTSNIHLWFCCVQWDGTAD